jgi:hypothetical protein
MYLDFQGLDQTATWRMSAWQCLRFDTQEQAQAYLASFAYADKEVSGSVATTTGVAQTVLTLPTETLGTYIVSAGLAATSPSNYSAVSIISVDSNVLRVTALQTATLMTISVSGQNIQITQSSGASATAYYAVTKIARIL